MRRLVFAVAFSLTLHACHAQTLHEELQKAGIVESGFSPSELAQHVNGASARNGSSIYLVYMRVNAGDELAGFPRAIRYEPGSGLMLRKDLAIRDEDICCGSPGGISFTQSYELFEFHLNPSASAVIVADSKLQPTEVLYGFGEREIAPDEVIFTESMVHFAPVHAERIMLANLRTGAAQELYPPKGDALRTAFARDHAAKMPPAAVCEAMNDPCDPDDYDEDIEWVRGDGPDRFLLHVSRNAVHAMKKDEPPDSVLNDEALYVYERRRGEWFYCGVEITGDANKQAPCNPKAPVDAGEDADSGSFVRKAN